MKMPVLFLVVFRSLIKRCTQVEQIDFESNSVLMCLINEYDCYINSVIYQSHIINSVFIYCFNLSKRIFREIYFIEICRVRKSSCILEYYNPLIYLSLFFFNCLTCILIYLYYNVIIISEHILYVNYNMYILYSNSSILSSYIILFLS